MTSDRGSQALVWLDEVRRATGCPSSRPVGRAVVLPELGIDLGAFFSDVVEFSQAELELFFFGVAEDSSEIGDQEVFVDVLHTR